VSDLALVAAGAGFAAVVYVAGVLSVGGWWSRGALTRWLLSWRRPWWHGLACGCSDRRSHLSGRRS